MSIDFSGVKNITIPEGRVTKITRGTDGAVLWNADTGVYTVATSLVNITPYQYKPVNSSTVSSTINKGEELNVSLTAKTGKTLVSYSVTMGGVDVTSAYTTVQIEGARVSVNIPSVTGNVVIIATAA